MQGGKSQIRDINLDADCRLGSPLAFGARGIKAYSSTSINTCGTSDDMVTKKTMLGKIVCG